MSYVWFFSGSTHSSIHHQDSHPQGPMTVTWRPSSCRTQRLSCGSCPYSPVPTSACLENASSGARTGKMQKVKVNKSGLVSDSLWPMDKSHARLLCPWNSPGKDIEVGCHALLQGIFPTQGSNLDLPHYRQILYCLSYQGIVPFTFEVNKCGLVSQ